MSDKPLPEFEPDLDYTEDVMIALYNDFLWATDLPQESAESLILMELTKDQRSWLSEFIRRWEHMEEMAKL